MIELTKKQKRQIQIYQKIVLEKNRSINLISRKNPQKQWELLLKQGLLSSEILAPVFKSSVSDVLDIGSGNGFPGLLFAMLFPKRKFYLCERIRKKAEILKFIKHESNLPQVQILCQPAEELNRAFDFILSQAGLPLEKMIRLLQKLLSPQGKAFLWHSEKGKKKTFSSPMKIEVFKSYEINKKIKCLLKVSAY